MQGHATGEPSLPVIPASSQLSPWQKTQEAGGDKDRESSKDAIILPTLSQRSVLQIDNHRIRHQIPALFGRVRKHKSCSNLGYSFGRKLFPDVDIMADPVVDQYLFKLLNYKANFYANALFQFFWTFTSVDHP
jgi:hypothetical protein